MWALDFADSQIGRAEQAGPDVRLVLSSAHVHPMSVDAAGQGYLSPLVLMFRNARCSGELAHALGRVAAGELRVGGQTLRVLRLPFEVAGPLRCHLALANGTVLEIAADSVGGPLDGNETFVESYAC
ncbi:MAG: hypothetical protein VW687_07895 [Curvibacter sp.]